VPRSLLFVRLLACEAARVRPPLRPMNSREPVEHVVIVDGAAIARR
jgi:hypothetical protein